MASIDLSQHNNFQQFELFAKWIFLQLEPWPLSTLSTDMLLNYKLECLGVHINRA